MADFIRAEKSAEQELEEIKQIDAKLAEEQKEIMDELNFSDEEMHIINMAKESAFLKLFRKDSLYIGYCNMHPWVNEMAKRTGLDDVTVRYLDGKDIEEFLIKGTLDKEKIRERMGYCISVISTDKLGVIQGKEAEEFSKIIEREEVDPSIKELQGECACEGNGIGIAKLVKKTEDMEKFNQGDILISPATNPNLVPAMKKAAAIVTDEGGLTCHAAIVSRELNIPCLTGTKIVTKWLKDGDKVEVDATNGIIRRVTFK